MRIREPVIFRCVAVPPVPADADYGHVHRAGSDCPVYGTGEILRYGRVDDEDRGRVDSNGRVHRGCSSVGAGVAGSARDTRILRLVVTCGPTWYYPESLQRRHPAVRGGGGIQQQRSTIIRKMYPFLMHRKPGLSEKYRNACS